jgi:hypothetical protein
MVIERYGIACNRAKCLQMSLIYFLSPPYLQLVTDDEHVEAQTVQVLSKFSKWADDVACYCSSGIKVDR